MARMTGSAAADGELDTRVIGRALLRHKRWIIGPTLLVAVLTAVTVNLLTPKYKSEARILYDGHLALDLEFHILIRNLLRRLSLLYYFHCGGDPSGWDFKGLIEKAKEVRVKEKKLRWHDWERYSGRQETRMKMGGFLGEIIFEGEIGPFMPLIKAGEILHVGKGTSFGLGKYRIGRDVSE